MQMQLSLKMVVVFGKLTNFDSKLRKKYKKISEKLKKLLLEETFDGYRVKR